MAGLVNLVNFKEIKNVFDSGGLKSAVVTPAYGAEGYER